MWKDTTSYSRDKERIPTTWSLAIADLRITVTCGHIHHPDEWIMHCDPWFRERELGVKTKEEAQAKALEMVRKKIAQIQTALTSGQ